MSKNNNTTTQGRKSVLALVFFILFLASAALNVISATGCVSMSEFDRVEQERNEYRKELWRIAKDVGVGHGLTPESARENIEKRLEELKYSGETMSEHGRMVSSKEALSDDDWKILQSYHEHAMSTTNLALGHAN